MDYFKIQAKLLEAYGKDPARWKHRIVDDNAYYSPDGTVIFIIPEAYHRLRFISDDKFEGFTQVIKHFDKCEMFNAEYADETCKVKDVGVVVKLKAKGFDVWVSDKKLKMFGKHSEFTFRASSALTPVQVLWGNKLIGVISPVRVKTE